eukprot:XP_014027686.1 PREDICTED: carnosine N-methyltransferase-like isoform X2 [Salmo salar]
MCHLMIELGQINCLAYKISPIQSSSGKKVFIVGDHFLTLLLFSLSNLPLFCPSSFLRCEKVNSMTLYPWIHQFSNNKRSSGVNPQSLPPNSDFSMVAGDFQVFTEPNTWDCVATCFFIDTAHVIDYVETIWNILKPGGVWLNLGPLLYHFENIANELSIELSYEDVRVAILKYGFHLEVTHKDDDGNDLCTFNSFQYWRVPLPELDISLLQNGNLSGSNGEPPAKELSCEAMES